MKDPVEKIVAVIESLVEQGEEQLPEEVISTCLARIDDVADQCLCAIASYKNVDVPFNDGYPFVFRKVIGEDSEEHGCCGCKDHLE